MNPRLETRAPRARTPAFPPRGGRGSTAGEGRRARAFTIIELMLAVAIFSMVLTAIYASWSAILRSSRLGNAAAAEVQRSRVAARTLQDALSSTVYYVANAGLYSFETDTSSEFAALSFVARLPGSFPGSGYFGDLVVRRVTFTVERNTDGVNELLMTQLPLLQTNVTGQLAEPIVLARQVNLFALEFWDSRANEWVGEWLQTNQLPKLVRFALAFGQDAPTATRRRDVTMRVVSLASSAVQPDWQLPRAVPGGPAGPGTPGGGPGRGRGGPGTVTGPPPNAAAGFFDSGGRLGVFQGISGPGGRR